LIPAVHHPIAIVDHVAQKQHALRPGDRVATQLLGPVHGADRVHLIDRDAIPLVAVLVLERIVLRIRRDQGEPFFGPLHCLDCRWPLT